jgi:hypothetical protein
MRAEQMNLSDLMKALQETIFQCLKGIRYQTIFLRKALNLSAFGTDDNLCLKVQGVELLSGGGFNWLKNCRRPSIS